MMVILKSMLSAFLMYSKIPVPQVEWKEENRRYSFCFFPLIGVVIGALLMLWYWLCGVMELKTTLFAAGCAVLPVLATGGIHLDGFMDVADAKSSYGDRERLLQIMGDSHVGAFAVIHLLLLFLVEFGFFTEVLKLSTLLVIAVGYVLSRTFSGLAAVTFRCAKKDGALQSFAKPAHRQVTLVVLLLYMLACIASMLLIDLPCGAAALLAATAVFLYYRRFAYKRFGGITGDLEGWFLQVCEAAVLIAAVIAAHIV